VIQDPKDIDFAVIKESINLLIVLQASPDAREITYESNVILPILGLLTSNNKDVRALWYEAMKEFCAYQNFR
jgi:hypothetical protein